MSLADINFEDISEDHISSLRDNAVQEGRYVEYKLALDWKNSEGKRKLLKAISALANSSGGHVVIGIREDKGVPVEICGVDLEDPDGAILQIENILRDGLDPRLDGLAARCIKLKNGKYVVVVRVQKSWFGPHMVVDDGRFYYRHSAGSSPMDTHELRNAFLLTGSLPAHLRKYRLERLAMIESGSSPLGINSQPKAVVHIIPTVSLDSAFQMNWNLVASERVIIFPLARGGATKGRLNLDGHVVFNFEINSEICDSYLQWFRNGIVETVNAGFMEKNVIAGNYFAQSAIKLVQHYTSHMSSLGITYPITIMCSFLGVRGFRLERTGRFNSPEKVDRDDLIIPEVVIANSESEIGKCLEPIFEALWNSVGMRYISEA